MLNFDKAFDIVIGVEAGYSNDPRDPGGETNWGITIATLRQSIIDKIVPDGTTVKGLTKDQAKLIYKANYWSKIHGDEIASPLDVFAFDSSVNQGLTASVKMMQLVLKVPQTGIMDVVTVGKAKFATAWHAQVFMARRAMRYNSTRNADVYLEGWLTRLFTVTMKGL